MNDAERMKERVRDLLRSLAAFSDREGRRILLLVPLLVALSLLFFWLGKPKFERSFALWADAAADSARRARCEEFRKADAAGGRSRASSASDSLFAFDPNTVREDELIRLGFTSRQAAGILHYREAGAVFRRAEDFSRCYTVSDEMYRRLESYIRIGADVRSRNAGVGRSSFRPEEAVPLELNSADSAALVALRGIGPLTAGRIVRYRERLGGYACVEQLQEIEGMTDRNYRLIEQQIFVDSSKIKKIDINFALPNRMKVIPTSGTSCWTGY